MYKILANTIFLGKDIINLPECHSTNEIAMAKVKSKEGAEGTIVVTESQTKGKGQRGNVWYTQAGKNLTFSLILSPNFLKPLDQFNLNIVASKAIHEVLSQYVQGLKIKWPNDIVHEYEGKLGGILIENLIGQNAIEYAIVGIGLNLNQHEFEISSATSIAKLSGMEVDRGVIFKLLIQKIESNYIELKKGRKNNLKNYYMRNLYKFDQIARYKDSIEFEGKIVAINDYGQLGIQTKEGAINYYNFKEVSFL